MSAALTYAQSSENSEPERGHAPVAANDNVPLGRNCHLHLVHDARGLMTAAAFSSSGNAAGEVNIAHFEYDQLGRRSLARLGHDAVNMPTHAQGGQAYVRRNFEYDADSDLKQLNTRWANVAHTGASALLYRYDQDGSGKITKAYTPRTGWRYTPTPRLQTYTGDGLTADDPANALDQYATVDLGDGAGALTQSYDGAGNLTSDGDGRVYSYNSENQMTHAVKPGANGFDMEYWYDANGRRSHSIDHKNGTETFHKHLGEMEVEDYSICRTALVGGACPITNIPGAGVITKATAVHRIILGSGVDVRIAFHDVDGDDLSFYLTNHQGSTVAMTNETGDLLPLSTGGRYVYDPYGNDTRGAAVTGQPYRYTGRRLDAQTGLYYYRARYYDPKIGKFLQTDPIGYEDQMNLYNYVGNDPLNATDPSGKSKWRKPIRWFVQTVNGRKKSLPTEKDAVTARNNGKNVIVEGRGKERSATQIETKNSGKGNVVKHEPHPDGNPEHLGTTTPHYQPKNRKKAAKNNGQKDKGKKQNDGHTFVRTVPTLVGTGFSAHDWLDTANDPSALDAANLIDDWINPFSIVEDIAVVMDELHSETP